MKTHMRRTLAKVGGIRLSRRPVYFVTVEQGRPPVPKHAQFDEDRPMTLDALWIRRAQARTGAAVLPLLLAGCAVLFPPRRGVAGGAAPSATPATAATAAVERGSRSKPGASLYSR